MSVHHSLPRRILAASTSVALVAAGVLALDHHVEQEHQVCAEHGELIHVETGAIAEAPQTRGAGEEVDKTSSDGEHGEHCGITWSAPESPSETGDVVGSRVDNNRNVTLVAGTELATTRLYRLAPKTSPPA